jgi:hypothetical protein
MQRGHIVDHVERLRAKPEHIRMRMAMGLSFGITAIVLVIWGSATVASGQLALNPFNDPTQSSVDTSSNNTIGGSLVAGAASAIGVTKAPAALTPVDVATTTRQAPANSSQDTTGGNQTVIPF